jgi:Ca2+-binding RTX toxin-like protein
MSVRRNKTTNSRRFRTLSLESLEVRQMLSANTAAAGKAATSAGVFDSGLAQAISFNTDSGRLVLNGDDGVNNAYVSIDTKDTKDVGDDDVVASITRGSDTFSLRISRIADRHTLAPSVREIVFQGYGGDDVFTNATPFRSVARGGLGNDRMTGGSGDDSFYGDDGDDYMVLGAGNDIAYGGNGNDSIFGEDGNDSLYGEAGNDILQGGAGDDVEYGGLDNDQLFGGDGYNYLYGDAGLDLIRGGDFGNSIYGGADDDQIWGGYANDNIDAGVGNDSIWAGFGNDLISAGDGNDVVDAGDGNDLVSGGIGDDIISGRLGDDTLYGDDGNDIISGDEGVDNIHGGNGNDTLYGIHGSYWGRSARNEYDGVGDLLYGEAGDDVLYVGARDIWEGGAGKNTINVAKSRRYGR